MINVINASVPDKSEPSKIARLKHINIGVFFDGTSNNMVQQAHYKTFKTKWKGWLSFGKESDPHSKDSSREQRESYDAIDTKIREIRRTRYDELEKLQIEAHIDSLAISDDKSNAYSNVAILHSALKHHEDTQDTKFYNIYVEGSGADSLADSEGSSIGGLGFGVGKRGVTSLVAKACDYIYRYLSSLKSLIDEDTQIHLYVFGFSRGATCARLFSQLATRPEGSTLVCEPELVRYSKECVRKNRLALLEPNFISLNGSGVGVIKRNKVFVEFLGIFDTVSAIGFLMQADGSVNPIRNHLESMDSTREFVRHSQTDQEIYHYNNAYEYGLYINTNDQMKEVFHIGAADEYRENFAFMSIGKGISKGLEIVMPGCHSDIGGSYVEYSGNKERVLYRFVPRLGDVYKKDENADVRDTEKVRRYEKSKRLTFFVSEKTRNSISLYNPIDHTKSLPLTRDGLSAAGWIDTNYATTPTPTHYLDPECENKCTLRYADSDESDSRCVKFSHNARGFYSNIPLRMMLARCTQKVKTIKGGDDSLFDSTVLEKLFPYPGSDNGKSDIEYYGNSLVKLAATAESGQRLWVTAGEDYFSESYRKLRLKYLHFTASCQIVNWKLQFDFADIDWSNFGNECNYTDDGKICRIMYEGSNSNVGSSRAGVKILQIRQSPDQTLGNVRFTHKVIYVDPVLYEKK